MATFTKPDFSNYSKQWKRKRHCFSRLLPPGIGGATALQKSENPRWWWRQRRWRWSLIDQEWADRHSLDGGLCSLVDVCLLLSKLAFFPQDQLVPNPAYLSSRCFTLPFHSTEIRVSWSNLDSYSYFFRLDSSHVTNAVYTTVAP